MKLVTLHGFLGRPEHFSLLAQDFPLHSVDLLDILERSSNRADFFLKLKDSILALNDDICLLGYSLGGRIALELAANHLSCKKLALLSTHSGLTSEAERELRKKQDETWAQRYEASDFSDFLALWQDQAVLEKGTQNETFFRFSPLWPRALRELGLSSQSDFKNWIKTDPLPKLILAGERDEKFKQLASQFDSLPSCKVKLVPSAGHRVLWDNPTFCKNELKQFFYS